MNTMTTIRLKQIATLVLGMAITLVSCEPQPQDGSDGPKHGESAVERRIDDNIGDQKQQNLANFTKELKTVYSISCTKVAVDRLYEAYKKVKGYERSEIDKAMRGAGLAPLDDAAFIHFLHAQAEFFEVFDKSFNEVQEAKQILIDLQTVQSKKTKFSKEQMELIVYASKNTFYTKWYLLHKPECRDGQFYKYIKNNKSAVEETRIEVEQQ